LNKKEVIQILKYQMKKKTPIREAQVKIKIFHGDTMKTCGGEVFLSSILDGSERLCPGRLITGKGPSVPIR
jgi:hypothetical protein